MQRKLRILVLAFYGGAVALAGACHGADTMGPTHANRSFWYYDDEYTDPPCGQGVFSVMNGDCSTFEDYEYATVWDIADYLYWSHPDPLCGLIGEAMYNTFYTWRTAGSAQFLDPQGTPKKAFGQLAAGSYTFAIPQVFDAPYTVGTMARISNQISGDTLATVLVHEAVHSVRNPSTGEFYDDSTPPTAATVTASCGFLNIH